jgi:hypothetical protein
MSTLNESVPPARKTVNWIIIAVVGVIACVCVLVLGLGLGFLLSGNLPLTLNILSTPVPTLPPTAEATLTPLATATLVPSATNTPEPPPTATFTMAAPQSLSEIVSALQSAAEGRPVSDAAAYDPKKSGIHPIIFYAASQELVDEWNGALSDAWRSKNVGMTELVAVIKYNDVVLERKQFFTSGGNVWVSAIRRDTEIILREAKTGISVATITYKGGNPPGIPSHFSSRPPSAFYGTSVDSATVMLWLKDFVEK